MILWYRHRTYAVKSMKGTEDDPAKSHQMKVEKKRI